MTAAPVLVHPTLLNALTRDVHEAIALLGPVVGVEDIIRAVNSRPTLVRAALDSLLDLGRIRIAVTAGGCCYSLARTGGAA